MKLWTIQTIEWYEEFQRGEISHGNKEYVWPEFVMAYNWLIKQMEIRIGPKPNKDCFPMWAWHTWFHNQKKPDLRSTSHFEKGTKGVRLEIEKKEEDVLLSSFELWHLPLMSSYLANSESDALRFDKKIEDLGFTHQTELMDLSLELRNEIYKSWDLIFDLDFYDEYVTSPNKSIQATFWSLKPEEIKKVDFFTAR